MKIQRNYTRLFNPCQGIVSNITADFDAHNACDDLVNFFPRRDGELAKPPIGNYVYDFNEQLERVIVITRPDGDEILVATKGGDIYKDVYGTPTKLTLPSQLDFIGQLTAWSASESVVNGQERTLSNSSTENFALRCVTGGTTGSTEPVVSMLIDSYGDTVTDGTVTWRIVAHKRESSTVVKDYFTYNGRTFLLTDGIVHLVYSDGQLKNWGRPGVIKPTTTANWDSPAWQASTVYSKWAVIKEGNYVYVASAVTGSATSGATKPTFPTTIGSTVVDGDVTWRCEYAYLDKIANNAYSYAVVHSDGMALSNPGYIMNTIIESNGKPIKVTFNTGSSQVESIQLYRSIPGTRTWIFVRAFNKSTLGLGDDENYTYVDGHSDESLAGGTALEFDNDPPPSGVCTELYKGSVFIGRKNELRFSKPGNPFSFPYRYQIPFGDDDFGEIQGIISMNTRLEVLGEYRRGAIIGDDEHTFQKLVIDFAGCVSRDSIVKLGDSIYFASYDGFYRTDGITVEPVSYPIADFFRSEPVSRIKASKALYSPLLRAIYWNVPSIGANASDTQYKTYVYGLDRRFWTRIEMDIEHGASAGNTTYFVKDDTLYYIAFLGYETVQSTIETKWLRLNDESDISVVDAIVVSAYGASGTLDIYYKLDYESDWTQLGSLSLSTTRRTDRIRTVLKANFFKFKFVHTGEFAILNGIAIEHYGIRRRIRTTI